MIISKMDQNSESWYEIRIGKITGTRFKDLMAGKSTGAYSGLLAEVTAEILTNEVDEHYKNIYMERGKDLEDDALIQYHEVTDYTVNQVGFIQPDKSEEFSEWIGISPDGLVSIDGEIIGGVEVKCPLMKTHIGYLIKEKLPNEYKHQVQGFLFVSQLEWLDFMSYHPSLEPFIIRVLPDLELHEQYRARLREFIFEVKSTIDKYYMKFDVIPV